jgi:hypothetical protein
MANAAPIAVANGAGIGPEIMDVEGFGETMKTPAEMVVETIDVYIAWPSLDTDRLAAAMRKAAGDGLDLLMIDNRGGKVWPDGMAERLRNFDGQAGYTLAQGQ